MTQVNNFQPTKERLQASSVLSSARSWGVKILSVDHALLYLRKLTKERSIAKQCPPVVKATTLNTPHLKIEDVSRKYKPLFTLYATFPAVCRLSRSAPLQSLPPPPWFEQWAEQQENQTSQKKAESSPQDKFQTSYNLPWLIGRRKSSYCECCRQVFTSLKEHLESEQHHRFAMDQSNYSTVDQVVAGMPPAFDSTVSHLSEEALKTADPSAC
ncbi:protein DBF4 homolog B-like [Salarias fasciatus]|uniref:protein DBF4 homolog B-like n=1 Tax=Salarias fasciatus TaxID=181472 RepID=UPI0011768796|nr:protein DBF4 homolog B-like [Salarias fasciatus]